MKQYYLKFSIIVAFVVGYILCHSISIQSEVKEPIPPENSPYAEGYSNGMAWAERCAAKEIYYGHPADTACIDFFEGRLWLVGQYQDLKDNQTKQ